MNKQRGGGVAAARGNEQRPAPSVPLGHGPASVPREEGLQEYAVEPLGDEPGPLKQQRPQSPGDLPPIPELPPHRCPTCQYNLTGLTHRRCPECGGDFSTTDAIRAGAGGPQSVHGQDLRALRTGRFMTAAGAMLLMAGFGVPVMLATSRNLVMAGLFLMCLPAAFAWLCFAVMADLEFPVLILGFGLIATLVGGAMAAMLLL